MIFVTLGTQDKGFPRLLRIIDDSIKSGLIKKEVIVQAGYTKYESKNMKIFDYVSSEDFDLFMDKCDLLITHAGVGSIFTGLKHNKKIMAMARLSEFNEQHNDHQLDIIASFTKKGYILGFSNEKEFVDIYKRLDKFTPKKYKSNNSNIINLIKDYIDKN